MRKINVLSNWTPFHARKHLPLNISLSRTERNTSTASARRTGNKTILVDELSANLHPILAEEIVKMFHDPDVNRAGAQLIFTTHDINLLDLDLFRRDQIHFIEKNPETAASVLYSLDEFSVRKQENVRNAYIQGRFGAIPFVGSRNALWE
jgi:AAA15 family ATPase/GTPase